ncbi:alpha/beta fold hydrolase [Lentzea sp. NPDC051213]|uniref:alpha/beta fold hydrolase n=1 Tax=Lentzea sp. NPDC051213 TaxID=3364126 RepID=UPI0037BC143E
MISTQSREILGQALAEIQELRGALENSERTRNDPIAIVGMACRMPGARSLGEFWELMRDGRDAVTDVPPDRFDVDEHYDPDPAAPGKSATRRGAFLDDIDQFDAAFFGISPREAAQMDPQQRLFLEVGWEALEHAGQPVGKLTGSKTGVFMGVTTADYSQTVIQQSTTSDLDGYSLTGGLASAFAPGRLAYWLGLQGPSLSVDTACSSSLVAVHLAAQSLRAGDCDMALAGGVNVLLSPEWFVILSKAGMMAPDGRCKTFDRNADGYVRGEGCGVVVLKRLSAAQADGDQVLAVLRGSAVNQDGRSSGITVPNGSAQRAVVREALQRAGINGSDVGYVEAHGTGTSLGDPIEVNALCDVLGENRDPATPFALGSVKTNIGHLESAAGIAGLIKCVLVLQHEQLPPLLHLTEFNPEIRVGELPITVPTTLTPWPRQERPRYAGVSSFGASGTNSHVVLEEAPQLERPSTGTDRPAHLLCLSARSDEALTQLAGGYLDELAEASEKSLGDMAFTANCGRAHFNHRLAVRADHPDDLRRRLAHHATGEKSSGLHHGVVGSGRRPKIAFLFTGQGSQHRRMGQQLFETHAGFRRDLELCDEILRAHLDQPLLSVLFSDDIPDELIDQTCYSQPVLFSLQYALARLWQSFGVEPAAVLGHSVGEFAAACVAGVFSLEEGLSLIATRGRLMQELPSGGGMAALSADAGRVTEAIRPYGGKLSIAAINGPQDVVVSGLKSALDELVQTLTADGIRAVPLRVSHAFHSELIEPMLDGFESRAAATSFAAPAIPLVSGLTGRMADGDTFSAPYVRKHARQPVNFSAGVWQLAELGCRTFVEIGPSPVLCGLARRTLTDEDIAWLPSLQPGQPNWHSVLDALGELYVRGADVDWAGVDSGRARRRVELPTYPFQRKRHWFHTTKKAVPAVAADAVPPRVAVETPVTGPVTPVSAPAEVRLPVQGRRLPSPLEIVQYQGSLTAAQYPGLDENVVEQAAVVNAGFYLEAVTGAAAEILGDDRVCVEQLMLPQAMLIEQGGRAVTQLVVTPTGPTSSSFQYLASPAGEQGTWSLYARGGFRTADGVRPAVGESAFSDIERRCDHELSGGRFYRDLWRRGLRLGPSSRWLDRIKYGRGEAIAWMRTMDDDEANLPYRLHPGILDAVLQMIFPCAADRVGPDTLAMLVELGEYHFYGHAGEPLVCHARLQEGSTSGELLTADMTLMTERGQVVAQLSSVHMRLMRREELVQAITAPPRQTTVSLGRRQPDAERTPAATVDLGGEDAATRVRHALVRHTADVLGSAPDEIEVDEPLQNLGLNSMMALELRDMISREFGVTLAATEFLDNPSVAALESVLLAKVAPAGQAPDSPEPQRIERTGPGGMHVVEIGGGEPVIFVHGGAFGGMDAWQAQEPLARRWRLIVPSRLNYGKSATSVREDFEEDAKLIAELLGDGAHLVAQSYGTVGAMLAAVERPDVVWSLTLIESAASSVARGVPVVDEYERGMQDLLAAPPGDEEELLGAVFSYIEPTLKFPSPLPADVRDFAGRLTAMRWPWEANIPTAALRAATFPKLVVTGGQRPLFEEIGNALAAQIGGERLTINGGHGTQNAGTPFNQALEEFLGRAGENGARP